ncbi:acyl-CoA/acyl-ACP dehydrogenase [Amycolatopsis sp. K13G38]|uniref:Acyl-CoA/acyl-ACP dehydrogenase n=1 Tax=Amycolatopsis acididurans TaxID=2724524 RepID=A0ABX1J7L4_9PSEU|nr:acyl-CoA dehydrogenase family protein [Amycolatopsis acididurans]NKQ54440.1 acyl-CoA/acyl-ACP dehydrogenase [Amycolatopsis acididurans]
MTGFGDGHDELRAVARDLLAGTAGWDKLAQAGWLGLEVPEELDGAGATFAEVAVVLEEMGRAAACTAYLGAVVLGVGTLNALKPGRGRDELLAATADGSVVPTVAIGDPPFRIEGSRVSGRAEFVPDAAEAGRILLPALDQTGTPVIVPVDAGALGCVRQEVLDTTRAVGVVTADHVEAPEVWRFAGDPAAALRRISDRAAVAVACDSLGVAAAMLDRTVAYAGVREQFGRPIGSFQAVKHACADMMVKLAMSRQLVDAACRAIAGDDDEAGAAASMAKSYACGAAVEIAGKAMQLHGGIGYTWESGIHVYLKRAAFNRALFGSAAGHRKRLAARYF